jgi:hypothetical protein
MITPEMARAELARRGETYPENEMDSITPEMARAELARRGEIYPKKQTAQPEEESMLSRTGRSLARLPRNVMGGVLDVGDFLASPVRGALNAGAKALGYEGNIRPVADVVTEGIDNLTGGYTAPQNNAEKIEEAVTRGIVSLPAGGGIGGLLKAAKNAPQAIQGIGNFLKGSNVITPKNVAATAGVTGAMQHSLNENPEDAAGAMISGLGVGVGLPALMSTAGLLTKGGRSKIANSTGKVLSVDAKKIQDFKNAEIAPTLADVSDSSRVKMVSSKLEKVPFVGSSLQKARELQRSQVLDGLRQGEDTLSKSGASALVHKGAKSFQKTKGDQFQKMFSKVEEDIDKLPDSDIGLENVDKLFAKTFKNIKTKSQEKKFKNSPLGKMYIDLYETAKGNGGKIPYHHAKDVLDDINNQITTHGLIGKIDQGKLKAFGATLSRDIDSDLGNKLKTLDPKAHSNWKEARKYYSEYASGDIPNLNELYKKDKKGATEAFLDLVTNQKKGAEKARIVLDGLDDKDKLALTDAIHKQIGKTSDGTFSSLKWVRGFKDLDPKGQKILMSPLSEASQKKMLAIADTIDNIKSTLAEANSSKTEYYATLSALAGASMHAGYSFVGGNPLPAAKLAGGLFFGRFASEKLLANPKFINWIDKGMKAKDLNHFQRILNHPPHVGNFTKTLYREAQAFQSDINKAKKEDGIDEKKSFSKNVSK